MSSSDGTLKHAVIGAAITLVTFFLPFSPVIGGAAAGYLHGPDRTEGAKVGGLSGLFAAVPGALLGTLIASVFVIAGPGQRSALLVAFVFFLLILLFTALYGGVLGAAGGFLGAFLNEEFDKPTETDPARLRDDGEAGPNAELSEFDESTEESNSA